MATLTAANSAFTLIISTLYPQGQLLQGYATDDGFGTETVKPAETMMGVDGYFSAGWVPTETPMSIMLQADSNSAIIFDAWHAAQQAVKELYFASAVIIVPGNSSKFGLNKGVLTGIKPIGDVKRTLAARPFQITWGQIIRLPV